MITIVLLAFLIARIESILTNACDEPFEQVGSKCLWKSSNIATQDENLKNCLNMGATLAMPKTSEENNALKTFLGEGPGHFWTGGIRITQGEKIFKWYDGAQINYGYDWQPKEPNVYNKPRNVCILINGDKGWDDWYCDTKYGQICEKPAGQCPSPTGCNDPFQRVGSKCLWKSSELADRDKNLKNCQKMGATLTTPKTAEENELLKKFIGKESSYFWTSGVRVKQGETEFKWGDGTSINYKYDWESDEPNTYTQPGAVCLLTSRIGWDDDKCDTKFKQVCEKPAAPCSPANGCDAPFLQIGSKCLWTSAVVVTRAENIKNCQKMGATLTMPKTREENELLKRFLGNEGSYYWTGGELITKGKKEFKWYDGTSVNYAYDWEPDEPNKYSNPGEICLLTSGVGWDDDYCDTKFKQACEMQVKPCKV